MFAFKRSILFFLFLFSVYCSIVIGSSWDEKYHYEIGKITFNYLTSFSLINKPLPFREFYSPSLWTIEYFLSLLFSPNYNLKIMHLINLIASFTAIFGIKKFCKILFNNKIANYSFIILFFLPTFFGHMSINPKDTILASCNVWTAYYLLKYLSFNKSERPFKFFFNVSILTAIGTGIQLLYIGSLIPIILFFIFEAFFLKKIIKKQFKLKKFFIDLIKAFFIFYLLLLLFWLDAHQNILKDPFIILKRMLSDEFGGGWPYNQVNGYYFETSNTPISYYYEAIFFKFPEYILMSYVIFFTLFLFKNKKISSLHNFFNYKIILILSIILYPVFVIYIISVPIYDGLRLFLWSIIYLSIIPAILLDYLKKNFEKNKIIITIIFILFIFFLYNFFSITPYQYTYLNSFIKKNEMPFKFENDYWGVSLKELIGKIKLEKNHKLKISTCGVNNEIVKQLLKENKFTNFSIEKFENSDFIIMTNRTVKFDQNKITNCFEYYKFGNDVNTVMKNGVKLSIFKELK